MTDQENQNVWNIKFDADRNIIIYDSWDNRDKDDRHGLVHKCITEIATKINMPVETELGGIKFQVTPGMTVEQSEKTYGDAVRFEINKQKHKEEFMETHRKSLKKSKEMTDEIRLGILTSETPNPSQLDENHKDVNKLIVSSHLFQDCVKEHTEEFSSILDSLKKSAKIAVLKDKIASKSQENDDFNFDDLMKNITMSDLIEEQGTDYGSVGRETLGFVCDEFYRRHKDDLEGFLGKDRMALLQRLTENDAIAFATIAEAKHNMYRSCTYIKVDSYDGKKHNTTFYDEFCTAKPKVGDKILLTLNTVNDPELGKLERKDAFIYDGGKYKHFYQVYYPQKDKLEYAEVQSATKAMQQKMPYANEKGIER